MDMGAKDKGRKESDKRGDAITCKCYQDGEPRQGTWGARYGEDGYGGGGQGKGCGPPDMGRMDMGGGFLLPLGRF